jgi:SAM-dependent methyltransferase
MTEFDGHYVDWRKKRIDKLVSILGHDFFKEATILELGCGYGHVGKYFIDTYNSDVTFCEGSSRNVRGFKKVNPDKELIILDQDTRYNLKKKFDLIIHWGVLYHLKNWKQDLRYCLNHSNLISLETETMDSDKLHHKLKRKENSANDQAINGIGVRVPATVIEKHLSSLGCTYTRYDDEDLNSKDHRYDWEVTNSKKTGCVFRRFWMVKK